VRKHTRIYTYTPSSVKIYGDKKLKS